ncbi:MAG: pilus assembly protein [Geminicoccaceae bacterium]|jgi:hypothetical protein|nr:pilus assembly protein [Geminicoccaceae bacterium]MCB9966576.1 pilus assembly protein [Geminicoccaceae bacterium]HRY22790.1 pilus assembly protein [Geminicoccaceae bacterium]
MSDGRRQRFGAARAFGPDRTGNTMVEFALIGPVFLVMVLGIFEICLILFTSGSLQSAVASASRYGITGQAGDTDRLTAITEILRDRTFGFIDIEEADISTLVYPSFTEIGRPEPFTDQDGDATFDPGEPYEDINGSGGWDADMGSAGLGGPGDIVLYNVDYRSRLMNAFVAPLFGDIRYTATIAVRNEPY